MNQNRVSRGVPTGGQFATTEKAESGLSLASATPASDLIPSAADARADWLMVQNDYDAANEARDIRRVDLLRAPRRAAAIRYAMTDEGLAEMERLGTKHQGDAREGRNARQRIQEAAERGIGFGTQPTSVAEVRRRFPVNSPVEVVYLGGEKREGGDYRFVQKQTDHEMITHRFDDEEKVGIHNTWAKRRALTDSNGNVILADEHGIPYVAYVPVKAADEHTLNEGYGL